MVEPFTIIPGWRGGWFEFALPDGCDMIIVCADTVQHVPVWIGLPHQISVELAKRLMDEHEAASLHVMPYRNADKIEIRRAALSNPTGAA